MADVFNPILSKPKNLFVEITTTCNYRCKHCHLWRTSENDGILSTDEKVKIVEEFFQLNNDGEVILSGGETMYKEEEFFKLSSKCRGLGLSCSANTNSSFINENNFYRVLNEGPNYLVISLDSHIKDIHDTLRGVKGSYEHVVSTIKQLLQIKRTICKQSDVMIRTNTVIFDKNIHQLYDYIQFAESLGIDGITFQILNPTFMNYSRTDHFFSNHFFKEKEQAKNYLHEIINLLDEHKIILTSKRDFEWMCLYIDNPDFISQQ
ncbi:MAG: radical SAM protein, partial [Saprospiraceae bacterium]|nr:radical SAM protein [Saprospiraceae bacterium]